MNVLCRNDQEDIMKKHLLPAVISLTVVFIGIAVLSYQLNMKDISAEGSASAAESIPLAAMSAAAVSLPEPTESVPAETENSDPPPSILVLPSGNEGPDVTYRCWDQTVYASVPLYVRSGPASNAPVIGRLSQGDEVLQTAVGDNGWSQISFDGGQAYAYTTYLSVTPIPPLTQSDSERFGVNFRSTDDIQYAIGTNKLRSGPGFEYAVMGHLTTGSGARRVAVGDNGWSKLIFHDTEVYACSAYLSPVRGRKPSDMEINYYNVDDIAYVADYLNVRIGPGTECDVVCKLEPGQAVHRKAVGDNGWCYVEVGDLTGYACSAYLSSQPAEEVNQIATSEPERPTPNSPFLFQYVAPDQVMPFGLFSPAENDGSTPLPLIISLHGALEIGEQPHTLKSNFLTKEFRNWEYTGLDGFDAYVVCPQLTGYGLSETWSCPETADKFFDLLEYLKQNYNIDENRISIEGHSLGGQGAVYMAADPRANFASVVLVSAYHPGIPYAHIQSHVIGFTGSPYLPAPREDWNSYNFMADAFSKHFGIENWTVKSCSHYDIPMVALREDADSDGKSDLISWILDQTALPRP